MKMNIEIQMRENTKTIFRRKCGNNLPTFFDSKAVSHMLNMENRTFTFIANFEKEMLLW